MLEALSPTRMARSALFSVLISIVNHCPFKGMEKFLKLHGHGRQKKQNARTNAMRALIAMIIPQALAGESKLSVELLNTAAGVH
jgi:hypothetical protein